jgi:hypothetical protein
MCGRILRSVPTKEHTMPSSLTLPDPIAAYFVADTQGPDQVAQCFTPKAVVHDNERGLIANMEITV